MRIDLHISVYFFLFVPSVLVAQWTSNPKVNTPICVSSGEQNFSVITSDNMGGAFIAWRDGRNGNNDIYAQHVNASGLRLWGNSGIPVCTTSGDEEIRSIVSDGLGGAICSWYELVPNSPGYLSVQRIDSSGQILWDPNGVRVCNTDWQDGEAMVSDDSGGVLMAFMDSRDPGGHGIDIYAQRIDASGSLLWGQSGLGICTTPVSSQDPRIISDGQGGAIFTWWNSLNYPVGETPLVYAQRVNSQGTALWDPDGIRVSTYHSNQGGPALTPDGTGGAFITWGESRFDTASFVYAQRIDAGGTRLWSSDGLLIASGPFGRYPDGITMDGGGGAIIAWTDERNSDGGDNADIFAQRVNSSGIIQWSENGVPVCTDPNPQSYTKIVSDGAGGAVVGWTDQRDHGLIHSYGQHLSMSGIPTWASNGIPFNVAPFDQESYSMIDDGNGSAIVTWSDGRNGNGDIFAQKLSGSLTFTGYRTFSPQGIVFAKDQKGRIGVAVKPNKGMPNEINVLEEVFRQGIFPNNPAGDALGGIVVGLSYLHTQNGKLQVDPAMAKTHGWLRLGRWDKKLMRGSRPQDVLKTFSTKGVLQTGTARGFDFVHERTSMPPAKYNNALMAEQIALKLNILVSACGVSKPGFGELRYVEAGNTCSGMFVRDIAAEIDSALALPDLSWNYIDLFTVIQKINRAFEGPMDVVNAGYPVRLAVKGVHDITDVPILTEDPSVQPRIVTSQMILTNEAPVEFALYQNYPNPFNPATTIEFNLLEPSIVTLKIYNTLGQEVTTLLDHEEMSDGLQEVQFDAGGISSGLYFYRINVFVIDENGEKLQSYQSMKKMLLIR